MPQPCPTCGHVPRRRHWPADAPAAADVAALIGAWWELAHSVPIQAKDIMELAEHAGVMRSACHGISRHGQLISFASRVLRPLIDNRVDAPGASGASGGGSFIVRRFTSGNSALYRLEQVGDGAAGAAG